MTFIFPDVEKDEEEEEEEEEVAFYLEIASSTYTYKASQTCRQLLQFFPVRKKLRMISRSLFPLTA